MRVATRCLRPDGYRESCTIWGKDRSPNGLKESENCWLLSIGASLQYTLHIPHGEVVQRRNAIRFQLQLPVIFRWNDDAGLDRHSAGFTRDISTLGMFVCCTEHPVCGTQVVLDIVLPPLTDSHETLRLKAGGLVVRVEDGRELTGFAAASKFGPHGTV